MNWLLRYKSALTLGNKLQLYKIVMMPIWAYGIRQYGYAKQSNIDIIRSSQSKELSTRCTMDQQ